MHRIRLFFFLILAVAVLTTSAQLRRNEINFTLQDLDRTRHGTAELKPQRFADMELVKELETNGFIDRIFGKKS